MMIPVLMVMPGIIPTTSPSSDPTPVDNRLAGRLAWVNPSRMSAFIIYTRRANHAAAAR